MCVHDKKNTSKQQCVLVCGVVFLDDGGHPPRKHVGIGLGCISLCIVLDQLVDNNLIDVNGINNSVK